MYLELKNDEVIETFGFRKEDVLQWTHIKKLKVEPVFEDQGDGTLVATPGPEEAPEKLVIVFNYVIPAFRKTYKTDQAGEVKFNKDTPSVILKEITDNFSVTVTEPEVIETLLKELKQI